MFSTNIHCYGKPRILLLQLEIVSDEDISIKGAKHRCAETLDPESYKKGPHDVTRFIKRVSKAKSSENGTDEFILDKGVIEKEKKYDGFYAVATNLDDDAKTIIEISQNRYKIEDCFRIMKTNFDAGPVYHHKPERINAHFMICYTALLMYRILEKMLSYKKYHFSIDNVIETMRNMNVSNIQDICYMSNYTNSQICIALNEITGLELDKQYYLPKELNKKFKVKTSIQHFFSEKKETQTTILRDLRLFSIHQLSKSGL